MPDGVLLVVVGGAVVAAILALPLRLLFRWPWIWAFVAGTALTLASTLTPYGTWGTFGRLVADAIVAIISGALIHRRRGWHWPKAIAAGTALFVVLGILDLPIQTHAVRIDMPRPQ